MTADDQTAGRSAHETGPIAAAAVAAQRRARTRRVHPSAACSPNRPRRSASEHEWVETAARWARFPGVSEEEDARRERLERRGKEMDERLRRPEVRSDRGEPSEAVPVPAATSRFDPLWSSSNEGDDAPPVWRTNPPSKPPVGASGAWRRLPAPHSDAAPPHTDALPASALPTGAPPAGVSDDILLDARCRAQAPLLPPPPPSPPPLPLRGPPSPRRSRSAPLNVGGRYATAQSAGCMHSRCPGCTNRRDGGHSSRSSRLPHAVCPMLLGCEAQPHAAPPDGQLPRASRSAPSREQALAEAGARRAAAAEV